MPADRGMQAICYQRSIFMFLCASLILFSPFRSFSQAIPALQYGAFETAPPALDKASVQASVRITPSPIQRDAAAGHALYYVMTVSNLGATTETYEMFVRGNAWPVTLLSADSSHKVTATAPIPAGGQFTLVLQLEVPGDAGRGVRDSMFVHVISAANAALRDSALIATTSLGPAAELPFVETFPANTLSVVRWLDNFGPATVTTEALNEPSAPSALKLDGANNGGDVLQSQPVNLGRRNDVVLQFAYQRGGNGNTPEPSDDFFIEYYNVDGEWLPLLRLPGGGPSMSGFAFESRILPLDAYHSSFRLRLGNFATPGPFDDWYVDDIRLLDIEPGRIPFAEDFSDPMLDPNQWPQNAGGEINSRASNIPSLPYALNLPGGGEVQSAPFDLSAENAVALTYSFEQTGPGEEPDAGDDLVFEFRDVQNNWVELARQLGSEGGLPFFTRKEVVLPPAAYHRNFRLRIRNIGAEDRDDWFVDDIALEVFAPSDVEVAPTAITLKLFEGDSASRSFSLQNLGVGDLFYRIRLVPAEFQNTRGSTLATASGIAYPKSYYGVHFAKGQEDWRQGMPQQQSRGGADNFGYTWRDSNDPQGPVFAWEDISATGTRVPDLGDDDNVGPFNIGFAFPFYDSVFTRFRVCSNGFISFTSRAGAFSNNPIPSPGISDLIAAFWDDLDARGGAVYYFADAQKLILQWQNVARPGGNAPFTFQIKLTPDGNILFQYLQVGAPSNFGTIGMQNHDGSDGIEIAFNTNYVQNNLAVKIQRPASWMSYAPKAGVVKSGGNAEVAVHLNATGLRPDTTYVAELRVESNDLDEPSVPVQVLLEVLTVSDSTSHYPPVETTAVKYAMRIDHATINHEALSSGDEIGVFTPAGRLAGSVVWNRQAPARLMAYGDDPDTPQIDGFVAGESMYFRVWDSGRKDRDYPATASFIRGDGRFGTADSAHISTLSAQTNFTRKQQLAANWSWIGFNVQPADPRMETVFENTQHLQIVKNDSGQAYIPGLINTIGGVDALEGYSIYLAAPDSVSTSGEEIPPFTPIPLLSGWNFVSYLPATNIPAELALKTIFDHLVIAKNDAGQYFIPSVGDLNTIGNLKPGAGYKLYLNAADTLVYPLGASVSVLGKHRPEAFAAAPKHFTGVERASDSYIVVVQGASVNNVRLESGDEIGIFTTTGNLVGAGVWPEQGALGLATWRAQGKISGAAPASAGYEPGAPMRFKIWRHEEAIAYEAEAEFSRGDGTFEGGAFALVELNAGEVPRNYALEQSYPNPFAAREGAPAAGVQATIGYALPEATHLTIRIYNLLGQLVQTLRDERQEPGIHAVKWNGFDQHGRRVAPGVYFYRMNAGKFQAVRKLVVM
ncbi:MAG: FlgD immunoglobulin-like domain containing protein [bacterium]